MNNANVNIIAIKDNWILHEIANQLTRTLNYTVHTEKPTGRSRLNYFINYAQARDSKTAEIECALFTHIEETVPELVTKWWRVAKDTDLAICMSKLYEKKIKNAGFNAVCIPPGVDLKKYKLRPVKIGIVGRVSKSNRKGQDLIADVMDVPGIEWRFTGKGWPGKSTYLKDEELPEFYANLDYVLIASYIEGGPMSAVEALASGVPIIAPEVGWIPELPHIPFKRGNAKSLRHVLGGIVNERSKLRKSVEDRSWNNFVVKHDTLFNNLLRLPKGFGKRHISKLIKKL